MDVGSRVEASEELEADPLAAKEASLPVTKTVVVIVVIEEVFEVAVADEIDSIVDVAVPKNSV